MTETADFNIKVTVRNARLLRAVRSQYGTAAEFCRATGASPTQVAAIMTMRASPLKKDGRLTATAEIIVSALGIPADDLWPKHIERLKAKKATVEIEMDAATFAAIARDDPEQIAIYRHAISRWSSALSDREKTALALRHSGATYDDVAKAIGGVTKERARQIEHRAYRKMKKAALSDGVREWSDVTT